MLLCSSVSKCLVCFFILSLHLNPIILNYVNYFINCYICYLQKYYTIKTYKYYLQFRVSILIKLHTPHKLYTHTQVNKYTITDLYIHTHIQKYVRDNYKYTFTPILSLYVFKSKIMNNKSYCLTNVFKNKCKHHHFTGTHVTYAYIGIIYTYCYQYTNIQYNVFSTCYLLRFLKIKLLFWLIEIVCLRANLNIFYKIYKCENYLNKIDLLLLLFIFTQCDDRSNNTESLYPINQYG